ncbi:flagellar/basal body protein [Thecamonas trahens ATCC 50062]|uniref:Flagellar/basal body protein n=1 Tax=Thecamonas trahens ATCC 50062 TaxID=461836 RepID=A0A0L0DQ64_THETB|nr:flagellar/basal body protein [Thecamonas trahens ATCC 50062]KNC54410.1 flagellar/basal body protein [Thecamonas trahens ATCC 50062]|eukprot:XP_013753707.1 flagellar/basal body protein [Thecamonas trahens ATCC 50062]
MMMGDSFLESPPGRESSDGSRSERSGSGRRRRRDFQKENVMLIKEKQRLNRLNREREAEEAARAQAFKLSKFRKVESKVKAMRSGPAGSRAGGRGRGRGPGGAGVRGARQFLRRGEGSRRRKPAVPRELAQLAPRTEKNFLADNARATMAASASSRSGGSRASDDPRNRPDFGKVPEYLIKRKIEAAKQEIEAEAAKPDPDCPPGMVRMPEAERLETLQLLEGNRADIIQQLNTMPLRCDTFGLKRKKHLLESKLQEADEAIKIFSKPKVFINIEDAQ